jgi:hypothetical protein
VDIAGIQSEEDTVSIVEEEDAVASVETSYIDWPQGEVVEAFAVAAEVAEVEVP